MQIKQQMLAQQIKNKVAPLYILIGQDNYLIEDSFNTIKTTIKQSYDCDEKIISIQSSEDWKIIPEEANSYSLFSDTVLLNILYDKKSIDAAGKKILTQYLSAINPRCFIIIRAPQIPAKQLQWLINNELVVVVVAYALNADAMKNWIAAQLKHHQLSFERQVPDLIHRYTQGNMLACAQVIEKIALSNTPNSQINSQLALEHLSDQCDYSLFELVETCLMGQTDKAIHIVHLAANNKTEPTLILWMLTQEVRIMLQLRYLLQQKLDIKTACSQLKIWPQRINLYQSSIRRFNNVVLEQMLLYCQSIDERIKSNLNTQVWNAIEKLALALCTGQLLGDPCAV